MDTRQLDARFAALADPTRRAMIERLVAGEATVKELAEPFALTQPAISKHLKVLEAAGLISRSRIAQTRPCRLELDAFEDLAAWFETTGALWEASFDRLGSHLARPHALPTQTQTQTPTPTQATQSSLKKETRHGRTKR